MTLQVPVNHCWEWEWDGVYGNRQGRGRIGNSDATDIQSTQARSAFPVHLYLRSMWVTEAYPPAREKTLPYPKGAETAPSPTVGCLVPITRAH